MLELSEEERDREALELIEVDGESETEDDGDNDIEEDGEELMELDVLSVT